MQSKPRIVTGALVGVMLTAPLIALMGAASQLADLPFPPFDLFDWITRTLPGPLVTFGIDRMIDAMMLLHINVADFSKTAEQAMAIGIFLGLSAVIGTIYFGIMRRIEVKRPIIPGLVAGLIVALPLIILNLALEENKSSPYLRMDWLLLCFFVWGAALSWVYGRLNSAKPSAAVTDDMNVEQLGRRQFLIRAGAATALITIIGAGAGVTLGAASRARKSAQYPHYDAESADPMLGLRNANDPVTPAPGTRPELTAVEDHYHVFIKTRPSEIDPETWSLLITGMVDHPLTLTLNDLRTKYEPINRYVTLSCISNRVGGNLIGTTLWTGASLKQILDEAGVKTGAMYIDIKSGDGFHETVSLDLINSDERIMLAYDWNSQPLPFDHGAPLRIYIPDKYGMKQPKWIISIEVTDQYNEGYWVQRGWDEVARMKATSVIDTVAVNDSIVADGKKLIPIGGIAHAGARGISKVEVRVDDGDWIEANLRGPLSDTTWVIWRYDWPFSAGHHTFEVRCVDGKGKAQIERKSEAHPSGATGIFSTDADM